MADEVADRREYEETEPVYEAGDLLISYLEQLGVEYLFGIPGGAIEPLYNALARSERRGGIKSVVARHETGAAFMAEGYARNSGRLGVCCSTTGPGATNLITGVASAFENKVPLLVITAQTSLKNFGKRAFQESADTGINIVGMFQFCTCFNTMVSHIEQLEQKLITAVMTAMRESAPVHLSIPVDILKANLPRTAPSYDLPTLIEQPHFQDERGIKRLIEQIEHSSKIVIVLGSGGREAAGLILEVAALIGALVVTTPDGKGLVSPYHPLYRGVIGFAGHVSASKLLADPEVDTIIAVGTVISEWTSNGWDTSSFLNDRLIHIESEASHLTGSPMSKIHVRGCIASIFESLSESLRGKTGISNVVSVDDIARQRQSVGKETVFREKIEQVQHFELANARKYYDDSTPIKPQWLMHRLAQLFPPNTRYLADTGNSFAWAIHYLHPFDRRINQRRTNGRHDNGRRQRNAGLFQCALEFASMGWAIGSSVGAALACPGEPIVCITGDGSLLMSGQEMTVALEHQLPVVFVVLNDSSLGMVKHGQLLAKAESIGHKLPTVDFALMAGAMGVVGHRIRRAQDLLDLDIQEICSRNGPTVLDVLIDPDEVPPMDMRIKVLNDVT
ncbi:MAG: thiamine pyrophosphate-binding protein [Pseudomonadales bacterium]